jgi:L-ascorbate peroxidase
VCHSRTQELVALSGAHTIGSKGFGDPTVFDNAYYKILLEKPWTSTSKMTSMVGLPSDHALVQDDECLRFLIYSKFLPYHFITYFSLKYHSK